jgi:small subunit ribosomal protein S17
MTASKDIKKEIVSVPASKTPVIVRKFSGVVVSDKSAKTIVVEVKSVKKHPKYKKRYTVSSRYKVHDEKNEFKVGDKVIFIECRPLSRDKRWRVVKAQA